MNRLTSLAASALLMIASTAAALTPKPNVSPVAAAPIGDQSLYHTAMGVIDLAPAFRDPDATAAVQLTTVLGTMNFTLDGETTPITVANFLRYVDEGRYFTFDATANQQASLFFHRAISNFVIQSGGFLGTEHPNGSGNLLATQVPAFGTIQNEPVISNQRGTIAMAKVAGNPNSATSQWFINLVDNSGGAPALDTTNGGFTVFGRVAGGGMAVADAIAALPKVNAGSPFDDLPVRNYTSPNPVRVPNLVSIPGIGRIPTLQYSATSSDPSVVAVAVNGSYLFVTGQQLGSAQVTVTATDLDGAGVTQTFNVTVTGAPNRLRNISTRAFIPAGDEVMIAGFIISGGASHRILARAVGPSLAEQGVANPIADTTLELHGPNGLIASNDDWQSSPDRQLIEDLQLQPRAPQEATVLATVPGSANDFTGYTVIIRSKGGAAGVGLVEVFDLEGGPGSSILNLSTRGPVTTNEPVIGGIILQGSGTRRLLVRALGLSLPPEVGTRLANPTLQLRDRNGTLVAENDNWQDGPSAGDVQTSGLAPGDPSEPALIETLPPGEYTGVIFGSGGGTGVALIEVYRLD